MGKRKKRRYRHPHGRALADSSPAGLLNALAAALNACEAAGMAVRLKHGAAYTRHGYVLPLGDNRWAARTLLYTEFTPPDDDPDDE